MAKLRADSGGGKRALAFDAMTQAQLFEFRDPDADYHAFIAIHSTRRGPAIGGTRLRAYRSTDEAIDDARRLAEAMSRKTALAGLDAGGGKSVIIAPAQLRSREALLRAHGRAIDSLGGAYITAPDVGISPPDLDTIAMETRHVARHAATGGVDGSDTARGTAAAIGASVRVQLQRDSLHDTSVAIQGCGNVGAYLARALASQGAQVIVADVDAARAHALAADIGGTPVDASDVLHLDVDVLAPCALGGVVNEEFAMRCRARIIAGAANNQLAHDGVADLLANRGVVFVPDIVASAGGVIAGFLDHQGASREEIFGRIDAIGETVASLLRRAAQASATPHAIAAADADRLITSS